MKKTIAVKVLSQLDQVISAWEANTDFTMNKDVTLNSLKTLRKQLDDCISAVTDKKTELTGLTNDRNESAWRAAELVTRVRSAFRGFYGPNTKQYEQIGGTRTDARKKPTRKSNLPIAA
jgi:hypothetical protein